MLSCGWLWIYAGMFLILLELVAPGFILCFFGLAAVSVGAVRLAIGDAFDPTWQLAVFSALSILYLVLVRRWFRRAMVGDRASVGDSTGAFVGRTGKVCERICPPQGGRVLIGDSEWAAVADIVLEAGAAVRVVSQQNITLKVEAL